MSNSKDMRLQGETAPASGRAAGKSSHAPVGPPRASRISTLVATFLRVLLLPVICIGIPLWPVLGMLCAVPIIGIITIPLFILTTALLLYSVAWFSYLVLAQADPPASSQHGHLAPYLPFLPFSPLRCLKINWAAFLYATTALSIAVPAVLDWSYRRVMVLGTQGGNGGIVRENIPYGSPSKDKCLDVYLPPAPSSMPSTQAEAGPSSPSRLRKHSTNFAEPGATPHTPEPGQGKRRSDKRDSERSTLAPIVLVLPSPIPPLMWTRNRKMYLQIALRLRRLGYCVVVPDLTTFPDGRVDASIVDLRLVLNWIAQNAHTYGGDDRRIYLLGHGMSAHLALLTLTQEAVVFSREGLLLSDTGSEPSYDSAAQRRAANLALDPDEMDDGPGQSQNQENAPDNSTWVDEMGEDDLPPGGVMTGHETLESFARAQETNGRRAQRMTKQPSDQSSSIAFPGAGKGDDASVSAPSATDRSAYNKRTLGATESISNGLKRVSIYGPEIEVPPVAGVILLAGVFDVIKCFRKESDRGVEHLSVLRRTCGPSHTLCLLHSPAHLLYAAKNVLDTSLLPTKFLLIHGGKDAVVDISQSTLLKTLLSGIGINGVRLRAYRELGHVEAIASLFLGMGKSSSRYSKQILQDVSDFIAS